MDNSTKLDECCGARDASSGCCPFYKAELKDCETEGVTYRVEMEGNDMNLESAD